eukprot:g4779.t1
MERRGQGADAVIISRPYDYCSPASAKAGIFEVVFPAFVTCDSSGFWRGYKAALCGDNINSFNKDGKQTDVDENSAWAQILGMSSQLVQLFTRDMATLQEFVAGFSLRMQQLHEGAPGGGGDELGGEGTAGAVPYCHYGLVNALAIVAQADESSELSQLALDLLGTNLIYDFLHSSGWPDVSEKIARLVLVSAGGKKEDQNGRDNDRPYTYNPQPLLRGMEKDYEDSSSWMRDRISLAATPMSDSASDSEPRSILLGSRANKGLNVAAIGVHHTLTLVVTKALERYWRDEEDVNRGALSIRYHGFMNRGAVMPGVRQHQCETMGICEDDFVFTEVISKMFDPNSANVAEQNDYDADRMERAFLDYLLKMPENKPDLFICTGPQLLCAWLWRALALAVAATTGNIDTRSGGSSGGREAERWDVFASSEDLAEISANLPLITYLGLLPCHGVYREADMRVIVESLKNAKHLATHHPLLSGRAWNMVGRHFPMLPPYPGDYLDINLQSNNSTQLQHEQLQLQIPATTPPARRRFLALRQGLWFRGVLHTWQKLLTAILPIESEEVGNRNTNANTYPPFSIDFQSGYLSVENSISRYLAYLLVPWDADLLTFHELYYCEKGFFIPDEALMSRLHVSSRWGNCEQEPSKIPELCGEVAAGAGVAGGNIQVSGDAESGERTHFYPSWFNRGAFPALVRIVGKANAPVLSESPEVFALLKKQLWEAQFPRLFDLLTQDEDEQRAAPGNQLGEVLQGTMAAFFPQVFDELGEAVVAHRSEPRMFSPLEYSYWMGDQKQNRNPVSALFRYSHLQKCNEHFGWGTVEVKFRLLDFFRETLAIAEAELQPAVVTSHDDERRDNDTRAPILLNAEDQQGLLDAEDVDVTHVVCLPVGELMRGGDPSVDQEQHGFFAMLRLYLLPLWLKWQEKVLQQRLLDYVLRAADRVRVKLRILRRGNKDKGRELIRVEGNRGSYAFSLFLQGGVLPASASGQVEDYKRRTPLNYFEVRSLRLTSAQAFELYQAALTEQHDRQSKTPSTAANEKEEVEAPDDLSVAVCISGGTRGFVVPEVHNSIRSSLLSLKARRVRIFYQLDTAVGATKLGVGDRAIGSSAPTSSREEEDLDHEHDDDQEQHIALVRKAVEAIERGNSTRARPSSNTIRTVHPVEVLSSASWTRSAFFGISADEKRNCLSDQITCPIMGVQREACRTRIREHEERRKMRFDWVLFTRPDLYLRDLGRLARFDPQYLHTPSSYN